MNVYPKHLSSIVLYISILAALSINLSAMEGKRPESRVQKNSHDDNNNYQLNARLITTVLSPITDNFGYIDRAQAVRRILQQGANPNAIIGRVPLIHHAITQADMELLNILLDDPRTNIDALAYGHSTPLLLLLSRVLLEVRANEPNAMAFAQEVRSMIPRFLERGADINHANREGQTPLSQASAIDRHLQDLEGYEPIMPVLLQNLIHRYALVPLLQRYALMGALMLLAQRHHAYEHASSAGTK